MQSEQLQQPKINKIQTAKRWQFNFHHTICLFPRLSNVLPADQDAARTTRRTADSGPGFWFNWHFWFDGSLDLWKKHCLNRQFTSGFLCRQSLKVFSAQAAAVSSFLNRTFGKPLHATDGENENDMGWYMMNLNMIWESLNWDINWTWIQAELVMLMIVDSGRL